MPTVVYYASGHGLGHAARCIGVCRLIPPEIDLVVRTPTPEKFWRGRLERSFRWAPAEFDCGAVQTDSLHVDPVKSLAHYAEIAAANGERIEEEKRFLRECGATLVVSDVPPFPIECAAACGIPTVLVANFTWAGIYAPYVEACAPHLRDTYRAMLEEMRRQYRLVDRVYKTPLSIAMPEFSAARITEIAHIRRPFRDVGAILRERYRIPGRKKLAMVSIGRWGMALDWPRLRDFDNFAFLSLDAPKESVPYVIDLPFPEFRSQDLAASVDVVVAKAGYGTVVECMANGTPLVYPPRIGFCEQSALEAGLDAWGNGIKVTRDEFYSLDLVDALSRSQELPRRPVEPMDGAEKVAAAIMERTRKG